MLIPVTVLYRSVSEYIYLYINVYLYTAMYFQSYVVTYVQPTAMSIIQPFYYVLYHDICTVHHGAMHSGISSKSLKINIHSSKMVL